MIDEILNFWFDYENNAAPLYNRALWWQKNESTDQLIEKRFAHLREQAIQGELKDWLDTPKGTLGYILLIDQFSRNLKRNTPEMFLYDSLALAAAKMAVQMGFDRALSLTERLFIYLPFEHSEEMADQKSCIELVEKMLQDTPNEYKKIAEDFLSYAQDHYQIILRFGRFPHRNKILARESTAEELQFMQTHHGY